MKRFLSIILALTVLVTMTACGGIKIPEGMNYYEYDPISNDETGWNVEHLYSVGLVGLRKPKGARLLSIDGDYDSDLMLFLVSNDGESDVEEKLYDDMVREMIDLIKRDNTFITTEEGSDTENTSRFTEVCYQYNGKFYAAYMAYYYRTEEDGEVIPSCIGLSVTSYSRATADTPAR